jgi:hypothetical protein
VSSFTEKTILESSEATGVCPINRKIILTVCQHSPDKQRSLESSSSHLSKSGWWKTRQLINAAVKDRAAEEAKKLIRQLHHLHVRNELLVTAPSVEVWPNPEKVFSPEVGT